MQKLIFTNSLGYSIEMGNSLPYLLSKIDGLGDVEAEVQTQKSPFQDGSTLIDATLEEREIIFEVKLFTENAIDLTSIRQFFSSVFNPKLGEGKLQYIFGNVVREIQAVPQHIPIFPSGKDNRWGNYQLAIVTLLCPNPFWKSPDLSEEPTFEPLFQFPFEGTFEMGIQRDQRIILNDGHVSTPIYVEFYGPATNPIITNVTTGEFIKVNRELLEGEFMRIDTTPGRKSVEFVAPDGIVTNVFNWIDLESSFFKLIVGVNQIEYSADSDIQGATVNIRYNKLYNAV